MVYLMNEQIANVMLCALLLLGALIWFFSQYGATTSVKWVGYVLSVVIAFGLGWWSWPHEQSKKIKIRRVGYALPLSPKTAQ